MSRIAARDEYYCYGCKMFHKFAERPPTKKHHRPYCEHAYERISKVNPIPSKRKKL